MNKPWYTDHTCVAFHLCEYSYDSLEPKHEKMPRDKPHIYMVSLQYESGHVSVGKMSCHNACSYNPSDGVVTRGLAQHSLKLSKVSCVSTWMGDRLGLV